MDEAARTALALTPASTARERTVDITTIGRRSGLPRRLEIWIYRVGDKNYLTGTPGRTQDWYRNIVDNPRLTVHLKNGTTADLPATGIPITDDDERRRVFTSVVADLSQPGNPGRLTQPVTVDDFMAGSILVELEFDES